MVARRLGQVEAYLTVREVLAEASTGADGVLWREFIGFGRFRFATLGFTWMVEKTTGLARASFSTREHIRAIDGSAPVENGSNLYGLLLKSDPSLFALMSI